MRKTWIVALTGASGMTYARRVLEILNRENCRIHLILSPAAAEVIRQELLIPVDLADEESVYRALFNSPVKPASRPFRARLAPNGAAPNRRAGGSVTYHHYEDIAAPIASGSIPVDGMLVVPASMGTIGSIASGISGNLIERAADVTLKEKRPLILVPRETPFNTIHLTNMLKLAQAGATVLPAMPGFYHHPQRLEDLIDFVAFKIISQLGISLPEPDARQYKKIMDTVRE